MSILRDIFQDRDDSIDDVVDFKERKDVLKFVIGYTPDFGLDIVQIFSIVGQEHLELLFSHGFSQFLNLGD